MSNDRKEGYCIIPSYILELEDLGSTKKILLGRIFALAHNNREGFCFATNKYLSKNLGVTKSTISRHLSELENMGFIRVELGPNYDSGGSNRAIYPVFPKGVLPKNSRGTTEKLKGYPANTQGPPIYIKRLESREDNREEYGGFEQEIKEVFEFWVEEREDACNINAPVKPQLNKARIGKIKARLEEGYTVEHLKKAVLGCLSNSFNVERGFTSIDLIFRNSEKVQQYLQWYADSEEDKSDYPEYEDLN